MKTKDVPQDDANMLQGKFREPVYSLDKDGNYTTVKSVGWDPKNEVMKDAWDSINERVEAARKDVLAGKKSPLAYYIEKNIMDVKLVAGYMGIWSLKVRRHLKPRNFNRLSDEMLDRYAEVFNITRKQLIDLDELRNLPGNNIEETK